jgi:hypothetical protein
MTNQVKRKDAPASRATMKQSRLIDTKGVDWNESEVPFQGFAQLAFLALVEGEFYQRPSCRLATLSIRLWQHEDEQDYEYNENCQADEKGVGFVERHVGSSFHCGK